VESYYVEEAAKRRLASYNCAQAVACAFIDRLDIEEKTLFSLMEGFGGGMGSHEATCGALSGAVAVIGLLKGGKKPDAETKANTYALVSEAAERFESICGSLVCKDILGDETGVVLYSCDGCVQQAVRITCNLLELT